MFSFVLLCFFFFSSRRRHTRLQGDWSSDVCSSDLIGGRPFRRPQTPQPWSLSAPSSAVAGAAGASGASADREGVVWGKGVGGGGGGVGEEQKGRETRRTEQIEWTDQHWT